MKLETKNVGETVNFDVKVKLVEKERKSQMLVVGFSFFLSTRPALVRFEIGGTAILSGKDEEMRKMLEVNPETRIPSLVQRIYPPAFTSMYLLSSVLNVPAPPQDLLYSRQQVPAEGISVEIGAVASGSTEPVVAQTGAKREEKAEPVSSETQSSSNL